MVKVRTVNHTPVDPILLVAAQCHLTVEGRVMMKEAAIEEVLVETVAGTILVSAMCLLMIKSMRKDHGLDPNTTASPPRMNAMIDHLCGEEIIGGVHLIQTTEAEDEAIEIGRSLATDILSSERISSSRPTVNVWHI